MWKRERERARETERERERVEENVRESEREGGGGDRAASPAGAEATPSRLCATPAQARSDQTMQRFRGWLVFKAHRLCVSLNSRLESNKEQEGQIMCIARSAEGHSSSVSHGLVSSTSVSHGLVSST